MALNPKQVGLTTGLFAAIVHIVWAVLVAIGVAEPFSRWVMGLHFVSEQYTVNAFSIGNAVMLVIFAFIAAFIVGYVFANVWNWTAKKVK